MKKYPETAKIAKILEQAQKIVIIQADNPDVDSLASSLALEAILGNAGKDIYLYCGVNLPSYLSYVSGWDRVSSDMPKQFDASIIVDTKSLDLLQQLQKSGEKAWVASRPTIILDHHDTKATIDFAAVIASYPAAATGEVIYELAQQLKWPLDQKANDMITIAILSDSLGLMGGSVTARTISIIAELVESGVNLAELDNARRETIRREPELIHYKGQLLKRVEFHDNNRITTLSIPWEEIEKYSPLYNPPMLVLDDMRLCKGTDLAIVFKLYKTGKITAKIRANYGRGVADKLAEHFGGGGHPYASGYKIEDGQTIDDVKAETIKVASQLLDELDLNKTDHAKAP